MHSQRKQGFDRDAAGRVVVCFLLAMLFLYNPFLSASRSAGTLMVCHPASHRATVGASELESLGQPNLTAPLLYVADFTQDFTTQLAATLTSTQYRPQQEVIVAPQAGFCSSLWFRPPPVL